MQIKWQDVRKALLGRIVAAILGALAALLGQAGLDGAEPPAPVEVVPAP